MASAKDNNITANDLLFPLALVAATLLGLIIFQTTAVVSERHNLKAAYAGQDTPFDQSKKVQVQLDALATGTLKLAGQGNKGAQAALDAMQKAGIKFSADKKDETAAPAPVASPAPAPAKAQ